VHLVQNRIYQPLVFTVFPDRLYTSTYCTVHNPNHAILSTGGGLLLVPFYMDLLYLLENLTENVLGPSMKDVGTKSQIDSPLVRKFPYRLTPSLLVRADTPSISKNPKFFAPKSADVRI